MSVCVRVRVTKIVWLLKAFELRLAAPARETSLKTETCIPWTRNADTALATEAQFNTHNLTVVESFSLLKSFCPTITGYSKMSNKTDLSTHTEREREKRKKKAKRKQRYSVYTQHHQHQWHSIRLLKCDMILGPLDIVISMCECESWHDYFQN